MVLLSTAIVIAAFWPSLAAGGELLGSVPAPETRPATVAVDVPYLPQTEALCGGAAAAMVFRFWGERHADPQSFAPLVDRRAGGIPTDSLVTAIRRNRWTATPLEGSLDTIRVAVADRRPPIVLIEVRPGRYHYVVIVGVNDSTITVHDPSWGPNRSFPIEDLLRRWKAARFWTLIIAPSATRSGPSLAVAPSRDNEKISGSNHRPNAAFGHVPAIAPEAPRDASLCEQLLDDALDDIARRGTGVADEALDAVRRRCPGGSRALSELAGLRFSQQRWSEAEKLAQEAIAIDPMDRYSWDVLGSSRFMRNDLAGALQAWNQIGKPRVDTVDIGGISRTRYALVAQALGLTPNQLLTSSDFRRASRRLNELPSHVGGSVRYKPAADGFAAVDVAVVERRAAPRTTGDWLLTGTSALVDREVRAGVPGKTGEGEIWAASWRWWEERPRVAFSFAAPGGTRIPGVWRVVGSWEVQTFQQTPSQAGVRETRLSGSVSQSDWLTGSLHYELRAGVDRWNGRGHDVGLGATLERWWLDDRLIVSGTLDDWLAMSNGQSYRTGALRAVARSSTEPRGYVHLATAVVEAVSSRSPLSLWPGAGDGHARQPLARAYPLLQHGVVTGPVFGRRLGAVTFESQRWLDRPSFLRLGIAGFADIANASHRFVGDDHGVTKTDAGIGLRIRLPGARETLRVDYAHGFGDGQSAVTFGVELLSGRPHN